MGSHTHHAQSKSYRTSQRIYRTNNDSQSQIKSNVLILVENKSAMKRYIHGIKGKGFTLRRTRP